MSTDGIAISKLFYNATLGVILETNKFGIEYPFSGDELRKVCYNKNMTNTKNTNVTGSATINGQVKHVEIIKRMLHSDEIFGDEWLLFTHNLDGTGSFIISEDQFIPDDKH